MNKGRWRKKSSAWSIGDGREYSSAHGSSRRISTRLPGIARIGTVFASPAGRRSTSCRIGGATCRNGRRTGTQPAHRCKVVVESSSCSKRRAVHVQPWLTPENSIEPPLCRCAGKLLPSWPLFRRLRRRNCGRDPRRDGVASQLSSGCPRSQSNGFSRYQP
jgi:hypothetical protein